MKVSDIKHSNDNFGYLEDDEGIIIEVPIEVCTYITKLQEENQKLFKDLNGHL